MLNGDETVSFKKSKGLKGCSSADGPKKKKRKKAPATLNTRPVSNVRIVDEDMSGFKIAQLKRKLPPKFDDAADGNGEDSGESH